MSELAQLLLLRCCCLAALLQASQASPHCPAFTVIGQNLVRPNLDLTLFVATHNIQGEREPQGFEFTLEGRSDRGQTIEIHQETVIRANATATASLRLGDLGHGRYRLSVSGSGPLWPSGHRDLDYVHRGFSILLLTDARAYRPGQNVAFQVVALTHSSSLLGPNFFEALEVLVLDPKGYAVREWGRQYPAMGVFAAHFQLEDTAAPGKWKLLVRMAGQSRARDFQVLPRSGSFELDVSVSPEHCTFDDSRVTVRVSAHRAHDTVTGKATVQIAAQCSALNGQVSPQKVQKLVDFDGRVELRVNLAKELDLSQLRKAVGEEGCRIEVRASVEESLSGTIHSEWSEVHVFHSHYKIELVKLAENFKPKMPFQGIVRVSRHDKRPLSSSTDEKPLRVRFKWGLSGDSTSTFEAPLTASGLASFSVTPRPTSVDQRLVLTAGFDDAAAETSARVEPVVSQRFLHVSLATRAPRAGHEVRASVVSTEPVGRLHYAVFGRGNVLVSGVITESRPGHNHTVVFVAGRAAAPICRLLAFYVTPDGRMVREAIAFLVQGATDNFVKVKFPSQISSKKNEIQVTPGQKLHLSIRTQPDSHVSLILEPQSSKLPHLGLKSEDTFSAQVLEDLSHLETPLAGLYQRLGWLRSIPQGSGPLVHSYSCGSSLNLCGIFLLGNVKHLPEAKHNTFQDYEEPEAPPAPAFLLPSGQPHPSSWLFTTLSTNSHGAGNVSVSVPLEVPSSAWRLTAFSMNYEHGLGFVESERAWVVRVENRDYDYQNDPYDDNNNKEDEDQAGELLLSSSVHDGAANEAALNALTLSLTVLACPLLILLS